MANPLLNERTFGGPTAPTTPSGRGPVGFGSPGWGAPAPGQAPPPVPPGFDHAQRSPWEGPAAATRTMTYGGVTSATGALLLLLLVGGIVGWGRVTETVSTDAYGRRFLAVDAPMGLLVGSVLVALVLVLVSSFRPPLARFLAPLYALAEGVAVGMISRVYDARFQGVVVQAVLATVGVTAVMLVLYGLGVLRATPRFVKGVVAATLGVMAMYLVGFVASLFGADLRFWSEPSPLGIAVSVVVVIIAALNLILDFDMIERGVRGTFPKHMEWFAALGLVVTLVWLYLELLRLFAKLQQR